MRLETEYVIHKYQQNLYLAAFSVLQNQADAQDALQMTFIKYHHQSGEFENEEHIRRWLFKTVFNQAKDLRRSFWRRNRTSLDEVAQDAAFEKPEDQELFMAVGQLPEKERMVLQLYYFENYSTKEMAQLLGQSEAAIRKRLSRARAKLKSLLKGGWNDEPE